MPGMPLSLQRSLIGYCPLQYCPILFIFLLFLPMLVVGENALPIKNLGLLLSDEEPWNNVGLHLGGNLAVCHEYSGCGGEVDATPTHGLSCISQVFTTP